MKKLPELALVIGLLFLIPRDNFSQDSVQVAEKAYLHIDRAIYNCGDDIWFKAYVVDAATTRPSSNTNNLHVELLSPDNEIIQSRVLRIVKGVGNGDFHLPDSLKSGHYQIRAYTNYMRNFDNNFFFTKDIKIINPKYYDKSLLDNLVESPKSIDLMFFPEGGSLVDSVSSLVAFKAVDVNGKGCNISGAIYSSSGELISFIKSTHLGMGVFPFKPLYGLKYFAKIRDTVGSDYKVDMPISFSTGITIHTFITKERNLLLTVSTNRKTIDSLIDRELLLTISSRNLFEKIYRIQIDSLINNYLIPISDFPDGVLRITLSKREGLEFCERLIYLQNHDNLTIKLSANKNQYQKREQVTMKLSLSGDSINDKDASLSLAVVDSTFTRDSSFSERSIASWFLLEADVHGPIENAAYYFDVGNKQRLNDLDLLLLTQGWRDFNWKYDSPSFFKHEIGFSISGRVLRTLINKPVFGAKISIAIFGENSFTFLGDETDSLGSFITEKIDVTGRVNIVISAFNSKGEAAGRLFVDSLSYNSAQVDFIDERIHVLVPADYEIYKNVIITKNTLLNKYKLSDTLNIGEVIIEGRKRESVQESKVKSARSRYGRPDKELVITPDMEKYPDILRAISGRIPGVWITNDDIKIRGETPLVLLDGIPIRSISDIYTLSVRMVDRVDVLSWTPIYGTSGSDCVINIISRTGENNREVKELLHSKSINLTGFDNPRVFYSPKYNSSTESAFSPDFRSTIFWEPNIKIYSGHDFSVTYYNDDNSTTIDVIVEGLTSDGIPISGKINYIVK